MSEPTATLVDPLDLANPLGIRAEMARHGLTFSQLLSYEDAERGHVEPLADHETQVAVRRFMGKLWRACLAAEAASSNGSSPT